MPELPTFLQPTAAPLALDQLEDGGGAALTETRRIAAPALVAQEETNWCWAAVTQYLLSIVRGTSIVQESVATGHVQQNRRRHDCAMPRRRKVGGRCRDTGCDGACNAQHTLRLVLAENGLFGGYLSERRAPTFDEIKSEINQDRPVPCRVKWRNGAGHFVLVTGWTVDAAGTGMVHVRDPGSAPRGQPIGEQVMPHAKFASAYGLSGLQGQINYSYKVT